MPSQKCQHANPRRAITESVGSLDQLEGISIFIGVGGESLIYKRDILFQWYISTSICFGLELLRGKRPLRPPNVRHWDHSPTFLKRIEAHFFLQNWDVPTWKCIDWLWIRITDISLSPVSRVFGKVVTSIRPLHS